MGAAAAWALLLLVLLLFKHSDASFDIVFTQRPQLVTPERNAVFEFFLRNQSTFYVCQACSTRCKLDQLPFEDCLNFGMSYVNLTNGGHSFEVAVTGYNLSVSGAYNWAVDFVPPTGSISILRVFTNARNTRLHVRLSEPCPGNGGFKCPSVANCDVVVQGPATVVPSSLTVVRPNVEYTLLLAFSVGSLSGRVSVALARDFCTDSSGNRFQRSNNSSVVIRYDRNPVFVNLWTGIKELQLTVNGRPRTLQATSVAKDLGIFLDFTQPILNSTQELQSALNVSAGVLQPTRRKSHGNRRFGFELTKVPDSAVVTVNLKPGIVSRAGTQVSAASAVTFLYDRSRPQAVISSTSASETTRRLVSFWIRFSKPVFLFDSSDVSVGGGNITRFTQVSKTAYYMELILPREGTSYVVVPENRTTDIAGNPNLASNRLQVRHYTVPASAPVSSSFITGGVLATFLASGAISISSSSLAAAGVLTSRTAASISSNPSKNLLGMVGHLQILALSYHFSADFPVEYSETVQGLQWLLPHVTLPWRKPDDTKAGKVQLRERTPYSLNYYPSRGANATLYGPALSADEYGFYFQSKKSNLYPRSSRVTGWDEFSMSMFWLGIAAGGALVLHSLLVTFLKCRTQAVLKGSLCLPRFELFILILALPCISQAASFVIRGGTTTGIIVGVLLLGIPCALFLSVLIFLFVAVIWGALIQYKEYREDASNQSYCNTLLSALIGDSNIGKWLRKEGLSSSFLARFGLLFENRRGPPKVVVVDEDYGSKWVDSEGKGIGRMKPVNSDEDSIDVPVSKGQKLLGAVRVFYILLEIMRRVVLGVIFGGHASTSRLSVALAVTLVQLIYLVAFKPFIRRGVQLVETVSVLSEVGIFACGLGLVQRGQVEERKSLGMLMVALLMASFMLQLMNEWFALMEQLLKLSAPDEVTFAKGLKMLAKGLVFPFIPQRKWPKFIANTDEPKTGLHPVVHFTSPSPDFQRSKVLPATGSPVMIGGAMYDPGSPSVADPRTQQQRSGPLQTQKADKQVWSQWTRSSSFEGKKARVSRSSSNELKTLRELAKASFPGGGASSSKRESELQTGSELQLHSSSRNFSVQQQQEQLADEILPMEVMSFDCNAPSLSSH